MYTYSLCLYIERVWIFLLFFFEKVCLPATQCSERQYYIHTCILSLYIQRERVGLFLLLRKCACRVPNTAEDPLAIGTEKIDTRCI